MPYKLQIKYPAFMQDIFFVFGNTFYMEKRVVNSPIIDAIILAVRRRVAESYIEVRLPKEVTQTA